MFTSLLGHDMIIVHVISYVTIPFHSIFIILCIAYAFNPSSERFAFQQSELLQILLKKSYRHTVEAFVLTEKLFYF